MLVSGRSHRAAALWSTFRSQVGEDRPCLTRSPLTRCAGRRSYSRPACPHSAVNWIRRPRVQVDPVCALGDRDRLESAETDGGRVYHGFPVVPETSLDGWCHGAITASADVS